MAARLPGPLLLLGAAGLALLPGGCGSPSHSLRYFALGVSEPSQGLPRFLSLVHLDGQPIARYDSLARRTVPLVPWRGEAEKRDPSCWIKETESFQATEREFRADLENVGRSFRQNGGLHSWQAVWGCELREDGSKRAFLDYGYDGRDFLSFNKETLTWAAGEAQARVLKRVWDANLEECHRKKAFLEETCTERLQRFLTFGKEALERTEPPVGKVTRKAVGDNVEALICQAYGFYPREIQATWMRDGEACMYETFRRNVAPNSDGTYYVWLSIEINPEERDLFECRVEHVGLQEPLALAWKEEPAKVQRIHMGIVAAIILGLGIAFLSCMCWRCRKNILHKLKPRPDHPPPETVLSLPVYGTEDEIQSQVMLQTNMAPEQEATRGGQRPRRPLEATGPTLRRRVVARLGSSQTVRYTLIEELLTQGINRTANSSPIKGPPRGEGQQQQQGEPQNAGRGQGPPPPRTEGVAWPGPARP